MNHDDLTGLWATLGSFSGIALIIWVSMQAKIARIKAEAQVRRESTAPSEDSAVLAEIQTLKRQMAEMHDTSHRFDLSFDEALTRLEGRIGSLETKTKTAISPAPTAETPATLRNGANL